MNRHRDFNNGFFFTVIITMVVPLVSLILVLPSFGKEAASGWIEDDQPPPESTRKNQPPTAPPSKPHGTSVVPGQLKGAGTLGLPAQAKMDGISPAQTKISPAQGKMDGTFGAPQQAKMDGAFGAPESSNKMIGTLNTTPPAKVSTTTTNGGKHILQGGVEHSQILPALPRSLDVGADFNQALLSASPPIDGWYWIPDWLAGDWRREQETVVSSVDFRTGEENREPHTISATEIAQFGVQRDRFGGVWHCRLATGGMADCGDYLSVALVQSQEPVVVSQEKVIVRDVFTELQVNKETHAIMYSAQAESLTRYQPARDGVLNTTTSIKFFDEHGMPLKGQHNQSYDMRTKPFVPLDSYKGKDLRTLFRQFLVSQGKPEYVP